MSSLWIIFAILHIVSIGFAVFSLKRLYHYIKRYRFDESKYTLLFRFIHLRWIGICYAFFVVTWIAVSFGIFTTI